MFAVTEIIIAVIISTTWHSPPLLKVETSIEHFSTNFYSFDKFPDRLLPLRQAVILVFSAEACL